MNRCLTFSILTLEQNQQKKSHESIFRERIFFRSFFFRKSIFQDDFRERARWEKQFSMWWFSLFPFHNHTSSSSFYVRFPSALDVFVFSPFFMYSSMDVSHLPIVLKGRSLSEGRKSFDGQNSLILCQGLATHLNDDLLYFDETMTRESSWRCIFHLMT